MWSFTDLIYFAAISNFGPNSPLKLCLTSAKWHCRRKTETSSEQAGVSPLPSTALCCQNSWQRWGCHNIGTAWMGLVQESFHQVVEMYLNYSSSSPNGSSKSLMTQGKLVKIPKLVGKFFNNRKCSKLEILNKQKRNKDLTCHRSCLRLKQRT